MGANVEKDINYYLELAAEQEEQLSGIRHWPELKVAFEENAIWVTGFSIEQIDGITVKQIPFAKRYYEKQGKLYFFGSLLPERNFPSLLWSPIARGLKVDLPGMNHNYFGIEDQIAMKLVPATEEKVARAMICKLDDLEQYIIGAPQVRLENLQWIILNFQTAFLLGAPLLPIPGEVFWQSVDFLIPVGCHFELPILSKNLNDKINAENDFLVVWKREGSYFLIDKMDLKKLSLSSFRLSKKMLSTGV